MKYDFDHWNKTEMTQEEALAWFESEFEVTDGKRCSPTCPQCQAEEWAIKALSVKQKKGKWLSHYEYCSKKGLMPSGLIAFWWCNLCEQGVEHPTNFCPKCGADMRG